MKLSEACSTVSDMVQVLGRRPDPDLLDALDVAADALGLRVCYRHDGRYHFSLGEGRSIAVSSESAGRFRVEVCRLCRPVHTMWAFSHDLDRLAGLVRHLSAGDVAEPV